MRLSYDQLTIELDSLFQQTMLKHQASPLSPNEIDTYCDICEALITASGWRVDEYYQAFVDANWDCTDVHQLTAVAGWLN